MIRHSGTVILHGEDAPVADSGERHDEASGFPVADRVVDRLLSDSIEVNGSKIVEREPRITRPQEAFNPEMFPRLGRQFLQRHAEIVVARENECEPACHFTGDGHAILDHSHDMRSLDSSRARNPFLKPFAANAVAARC